jgi:hypothetical protein
MAKKPDVVRFAVGNPDGPQSPVWRLWTSGKGSDVYLAARTIADQAKVSFHKSGKWRLAFTEKYASGPNSYVRPGEDRATSKWHRPPEVAPDITRSFLIMVPASEVTSPKVPFASKPDTIWVPTAPSRLATCLTIFFTTPAADIGRITADIGRISSFTQSVGRIRLRNRETVRVFAHHQQTTESQKTTIARGRVEVARSSHREDRSPEEFNSAFFFGLEKGVGFTWWFQTRASPQLPKGGNRNQTLSTELPIPFILGNPYSASRILVL